MRFLVFSCVLAAFLMVAPDGGRGEARGATRRALLIANSAYRHLPPLATPRPSVDALAGVLSKARFQSQLAYDLPQTDLISTIRQFTATIQPGDFVLIYYAGYGYQADELNYILPVGFDPKDQSAPGLAAFSLRNLQRKLEQRKAGTRMLILDASRPATGLPNGLAAMRAGTNTLVSFSAGAGQSAPDPPGGGVDVFTGALIRAISEPGAKPAGVLQQARSEVSRISAGKQVPLVIESPVPDFDFNPPSISASNGGPKVADGAAGGVATSANSGGGVTTNPNTGTGGTAANSNMGAVSTVPMWRMDGADFRRSGYAPYRGPRKPRIAWTADAGNRDQNSPLVGPDGRVYLWSARDRMLRAVDNGRVVWSVPLPLNDQVSFAPDGSVQLTSFTGRTRALNQDGKPTRDGQADSRYLGLYVWQGHSYNSNGISHENDPSTRWYFFRADDRAWSVEVDGKATWPSVDDNGALYVATSKGTVYAVSNAATILWSYPSGGRTGQRTGSYRQSGCTRNDWAESVQRARWAPALEISGIRKWQRFAPNPRPDGNHLLCQGDGFLRGVGDGERGLAVTDGRHDHDGSGHGSVGPHLHCQRHQALLHLGLAGAARTEGPAPTP